MFYEIRLFLLAKTTFLESYSMNVVMENDFHPEILSRKNTCVTFPLRSLSHSSIYFRNTFGEGTP